MSQSAESLRLHGGHLRASNLSTAEETVESAAGFLQMNPNDAQSTLLLVIKSFNSSPKLSSLYGLSLTFVIFVFFSKCFMQMYSTFGSMSVYCVMCWPLAAKMQVQDPSWGHSKMVSISRFRCIFITNALFSVSVDSEVVYLMPLRALTPVRTLVDVWWKQVMQYFFFVKTLPQTAEPSFSSSWCQTHCRQYNKELFARSTPRQFGPITNNPRTVRTLLD